MRTAIEAEAHRLGVKLVSTSASGTDVEFSTSSGTDTRRGRLWTEAPDPAHYESICRAAKKGAVYDRESGLWVKRTSVETFHAYRATRTKALDELAERNRKFAIEVLGERIPK
jgi:hypothetical protein